MEIPHLRAGKHGPSFGMTPVEQKNRFHGAGISFKGKWLRRTGQWIEIMIPFNAGAWGKDRFYGTGPNGIQHLPQDMPRRGILFVAPGFNPG